jgi:hypothetical protein
MTRRTILISGDNDQSQNNVQYQNAVESERTSHGNLLKCLSYFAIIPAAPAKRNKKMGRSDDSG